MRTLVVGGMTLILAGCASSGAPTDVGSPERTAHFLTCLPVALGAAQTNAQAVEAVKAKPAPTQASDVLGAINGRLATGDTAALVAACAPYVADLAASGNAQAKALQGKLKQ